MNCHYVSPYFSVKTASLSYRGQGRAAPKGSRDAFVVRQTGENKKKEEEANLFAGHFRMPDKGFFKERRAPMELGAIDRRLSDFSTIHGVSSLTTSLPFIEIVMISCASKSIFIRSTIRIWLLS